MAKHTPYTVWFCVGHAVIEKVHRGAPTETWMIDRGRSHRAFAVIRYFPSRKGWRFLDIRNLSSFQLPGSGRTIYKGAVRGAHFYPTAEAAHMAALAMLGGHTRTV